MEQIKNEFTCVKICLQLVEQLNAEEKYFKAHKLSKKSLEHFSKLTNLILNVLTKKPYFSYDESKYDYYIQQEPKLLSFFSQFLESCQETNYFVSKIIQAFE